MNIAYYTKISATTPLRRERSVRVPMLAQLTLGMIGYRPPPLLLGLLVVTRDLLLDFLTYFFVS